MKDFRFQISDFRLVAAALVLALAACEKKDAPASGSRSMGVPPASPSPPPAAPPAKTAPKFKVSTAPAPREIWREFSGEKAFAEVKKQVDLGPRPAGSAELEQARGLLIASLENAGWEIERQEFSDNTPRGAVKFVNLIARFAADGARPVPRTTQRAIVCSHYDTKRFSTIRFVGADDGASSTGALVELARVLALDHALASKVELVFFDGEEAIQTFNETDGLYGSRYYAARLRESGRAKQFQFGILWDMIGDRDLTITLSSDSPAELTKALLASAESVGARDHFSYFDRGAIYDDHVPLNNVARIPTIDLIDFDYLPWHTADDTLDKLSPASLQTIGTVTLFHLKKALGK